MSTQTAIVSVAPTITRPVTSDSANVKRIRRRYPAQQQGTSPQTGNIHDDLDFFEVLQHVRVRLIASCGELHCAEEDRQQEFITRSEENREEFFARG